MGKIEPDEFDVVASAVESGLERAATPRVAEFGGQTVEEQTHGGDASRFVKDMDPQVGRLGVKEQHHGEHAGRDGNGEQDFQQRKRVGTRGCSAKAKALGGFGVRY